MQLESKKSGLEKQLNEKDKQFLHISMQRRIENLALILDQLDVVHERGFYVPSSTDRKDMIICLQDQIRVLERQRDSKTQGIKHVPIDFYTKILDRTSGETPQTQEKAYLERLRGYKKEEIQKEIENLRALIGSYQNPSQDQHSTNRADYDELQARILATRIKIAKL